MHRHTTIIRCATALMALALGGPPLAAEVITHTVELSTLSGNSQNQFTINGTLDTLAQGLHVVPLGNSIASVAGHLMAQLTLETFPQQGTVELVGVDFLTNSFTQGGVSLFYDVPGTSRRVTFNATGVSFSLNLPDIDEPPLDLAQLTVAGGAYTMVQNGGTAEVGITNRPSKQQNLSQQSVLSSYPSEGPFPLVTLNNFTLVPLPGDGDDFEIELTLPMQNQEVRYTGVGLPVALGYSGTLLLGAQLPPINLQVPEPASAALLLGVVVLMSGRSPRIAFRG